MRSWSFRNVYAGVLGIAERIEQFRADGARKLAAGEFRSEVGAKEIDYVVRLTRPSPASAAHVSWLGQDHGFLMLADLLPQEFATVSVEFTLPSGWTVNTATNAESVSEPADAVFFVGRSVRKSSQKELDCFVTGNWPFKDSIALKAAARVVEKYLALTGHRLPAKPVVMIAPLPVYTSLTKWRAETRGSTVLLLIEPQARTWNWKAQLEIIFAHEALHLWVPNALRLQGDYDWFFEGFTLYTALLIALDLKAINFKEYLNTLARVYDSYLSYPHDLSLIEASERRWTNPWPIVYDKGMLVAFLYDLMLRKESGGNATLANRYRELFSRSRDLAEGNEVIIKLLSSSPAAGEFVKKYIEGSQELEFEDALKELHTDKPGLLKSLGYR
ncbi:MAG TPA: hypothetical protein VFZ22_18785 [Pyrinomonadaceae bacterium]|nr:hypothetical protein [Pyrinomonadaceae bacterium]